MKTKKAPKRAGKKPNQIAALRSELAAVKAKECSERLERETAERLLRQAMTREQELLEAIKERDDAATHLADRRYRFDLASCDALQSVTHSVGVALINSEQAMTFALGSLVMTRAELGNTKSLLRVTQHERSAFHDDLRKLRTAIRTWAESYFAAHDPARAWVLSMLDPVESRGGIVAMSNGSSIAVAAEGKIA